MRRTAQPRGRFADSTRAHVPNGCSLIVASPQTHVHSISTHTHSQLTTTRFSQPC